jgi:threonine dehydrogenase-like Zn-dependent dehydrogenase
MYFLGLDLGQKRDYSAVVVVERVDHRRAFQGTEFEKLNVRYVERLPLGTPYPVVVERMREIVQSDELCGDCALAVDATGVGVPVVDMLRAARLGCEVMAVTITGGGRESAGSVPKRDLLAGVEVLLEKGQLRIGKVREAARLGRELMAMRTGKDGGEHDDLVIALALACWRARRRRMNGEGTRRIL